MICADRTCDCGIVSDSLSISGSGQQGDPYRLETNAYSIVTSVTRPSSPFVGQFIWETNTQRQLVWTGAHWLIVGGAMPGWNLTRVSTDPALTVLTSAGTEVPLLNEIEDSDGFHTGTLGQVTIPAGYGGDYQLDAILNWGPGVVYYRLVILAFAGNTGTPKELDQIRGYLNADAAGSGSGSNNWNTVSKKVRLEAGAVVQLLAYQPSGADQTVIRAGFTGTMLRHLPTLA